MSDDQLKNFRSQWVEEINSKSESKTNSSSKNSTANKIILPANSASLPSSLPSDNPNVSATTADSLQQVLKSISGMSLDDRLTEAMKIYEKGLQLEQNERLQDSIKHYRIAHKLDNTVDKRYREKYNNRMKLIQIQKEQELFETEKSNVLETFKESYLLKLPDELLLYIMRFLVPYELHFLFNLSLSCKTFSQLFNHSSIWAKAYRSISSDACNNVDYMKFFQTTPHIRFEGIYISVNRYIRVGAAVDSLNSPTFLVEYYRYIRLLQNNTCLVRLSNDPPGKIVPYMCNKDVVTNGSWELTNDVLSISVQDVEIYTMRLQLKRVKKRFNKLEWIEYICHSSSEDFSIPLLNERSFKFSRATSIVNTLL
eukprot:NODE_29_length_33183_cov_0.333666.p5 type:complete len:368 gc:universal NODE_29_length_33183_cov_0.333666:30469-31572(+)